MWSTWYVACDSEHGQGFVALTHVDGLSVQLLLLSIAYIWAPGARTQMYSLYSQPTHFEEGDGAGIGSGDVELAGVPAGAFRINDSESDSDGDADLARPYSDADAEPTANANEGAHGEPLSTGTGAAVASTQDNEDTPVAGDASSAAADQVVPGS